MTEKKKGEMTVREAGRLGGHKGGEVVSHKVPEIREENKERGARPYKGK